MMKEVSKTKELRNLTKKRYNFTCPNCFYEQSAAPSLLMEMIGYNAGHGGCMNCDVFLHLEIIPDLNGNEMKATLWEEYVYKKGKEK